jgi:hypothetical protein
VDVRVRLRVLVASALVVDPVVLCARLSPSKDEVSRHVTTLQSTFVLPSHRLSFAFSAYRSRVPISRTLRSRSPSLPEEQPLRPRESGARA